MSQYEIRNIAVSRGFLRLFSCSKLTCSIFSALPKKWAGVDTNKNSTTQPDDSQPIDTKEHKNSAVKAPDSREKTDILIHRLIGELQNLPAGLRAEILATLRNNGK